LELANTYARINLDAILENYRNICKKAQKPVMAVVKADAYGHGAVAVAKLLQEECPFFGVSSVAEALELRNAGIEKPILILGHTPPQAYPVVVEKEIRTAIFSLSDARELSREAVRQGKTAYIHLAVDTGMSRIGFQVNRESAACCQEIAALPGICCE
jgi:alanine racemase